jgi:hypothetical protein
MKLYVHQSAHIDPEVVVVDESKSVASLAAGGVEDDLEILLEDAEDGMDVELTISAVLKERDHVFVGSRKRVHVEVRFNGQTKDHKFAPSARVRTVQHWAVGHRGFDLDPAAAADHTLAVCASGTVPPADAHIGSLDDEHHHVCLNLIPKHRFEG